MASTRQSAAAAAAAAAQARAHPSAAQAAALKAHALAAGFSRGYLVSAGVMVLSVIIALALIRISRQDLSGATPEPAGDATSPMPPELSHHDGSRQS